MTKTTPTGTVTTRDFWVRGSCPSRARPVPVSWKARSGETELKYQNFSILIHAERRLALVCASNVTREAALRRPEPGRDYSRKGIGGLGDHDMEKWFPYPRLDARFQLSNVFYTK